MNLRPSGYEPDELPGCSTPRKVGRYGVLRGWIWRDVIVRAVSRTGGGLLSRALRHSIIAAGGFNGRVRDGIGWNAPAWAASPANRRISAKHARACSPPEVEP